MVNFDIISEGLVVTVMGVCIVFSILLMISFILSLFAIVFKEKKAKTAEAKETAPVIPAPIAEEEEHVNEMDDRELIAVITAAIAASMNTTTDGLVVRSLRRVNTWNKEAIQEQQNSIY